MNSIQFFKYIFFLLLLSAAIFNSYGQEFKIYLSPGGNDKASGTVATSPLKTIGRALLLAKENTENISNETRIILLDGNYQLDEAIRIDPDFNIGPLSIEAANPGKAVIKGSQASPWISMAC